MLTCLKVRSLALLEELELELGPGLNVLTGETGAGKSMLIDALGLVLGDKARPELVRSGAPHAEVEALFDLSRDPALCERLRAAGIETDGELVVRRIVAAKEGAPGAAGGRSRAYVNGVLTTQSQLAELAIGLVEVSSQHEHQSLLDPAAQLGHLDAFARTASSLADMREAHGRLVRASEALEAARGSASGRADREDFLRYQLKELDDLAPEAGEVPRLEGERERLRHAEKLIAASSGAEEALYARDGAVTEELAAIAAKVAAAAALDPTLTPWAEALEAARSQIEDAARELGAYGRSVALDPERLTEVEERLHRLQRLGRKHAVGAGSAHAGQDVGAVLEGKRAALRAELDGLERSESTVAECEAALAAARAEVEAIAAKLSDARRRAADALGRAVTGELRALGMGGATLGVALSPREPGPSGADRVELLLVPNAGEEPRPLRKIASGGELSRTMLAIKHTLAGVSAAGLSVFDEVDTGVGGAVAEVMGQKIAELAQHHQVLCVTHLAPIAVYADRHVVVSKEVAGGRTRSTMEALSPEARTEEIARMLGGLDVTARTREAARELLEGAARRKRGVEALRLRPEPQAARRGKGGRVP
jgi:DNA repair protein RecN (Recombination protein N)